MLKFLGVGSCFNTKLGNTSAYYIEDDKLTLFDCGESIFERIVNKDLLKGIKQVDIYITHLHSDHVGSLPSLIFYLHFIKGIKPTIWFPNEDIVKWLELGNVPEELYDYMTAFDNKKYLYVVKQKHTIVKSAFGYVIKLNDKWIYYSGDTSYFNLSLKRAPNGFYWVDKDIIISFIYHDVTRYMNDAHANIHPLIKMFPEAVRKNVTLMHFDDEETIKIAKDYGFQIASVDK